MSSRARWVSPAFLLVLSVALITGCADTSTDLGDDDLWSIAEPWPVSEPYIPPLLSAVQDGRWGYIDLDGNYVWRER